MNKKMVALKIKIENYWFDCSAISGRNDDLTYQIENQLKFSEIKKLVEAFYPSIPDWPSMSYELYVEDYSVNELPEMMLKKELRKALSRTNTKRSRSKKR